MTLLPLSLAFREDEFSELHCELSHSQQEPSEDEHSVDQDLDQDPDQPSRVSLPENQSMLVTADMGKESQQGYMHGVVDSWLLKCSYGNYFVKIVCLEGDYFYNIINMSLLLRKP